MGNTSINKQCWASGEHVPVSVNEPWVVLDIALEHRNGNTEETFGVKL